LPKAAAGADRSGTGSDYVGDSSSPLGVTPRWPASQDIEYGAGSMRRYA
jgi:hypothetical protein